MTNSDKIFTEAFNLDENAIPSKEIISINPEKVSKDEDEYTKRMEEDFEYSRSVIKKLIDSGIDILSDSNSIAKQSESPRAYEVSANIMKTIESANASLMNLHKSRRDVKYGGNTSKDVPQIQNQQNNFITTTTSDLLKQIRKEEDKKFIDIKVDDKE